MPGGSGAVPPRQLRPRVDAQLNALILRMLLPRPEERGEAGDLAEAMKRGVAHGGPSADEPLFEWETLRPSQWTKDEQIDAKELGHRPRYRSREKVLTTVQAEAAERERAERKEAEARAPVVRPPEQGKSRRWLPWLAAVLAVGLWPGETGSPRTVPQPTAAHRMSRKERVSLGDTTQSAEAVLAKSPARDRISEDLPTEPFAWQLKPDSKGRCPRRQVALNGGCWAKVNYELEDCAGIGFVYQGGCYVPARANVKVPTSAPKR